MATRPNILLFTSDHGAHPQDIQSAVGGPALAREVGALLDEGLVLLRLSRCKSFYWAKTPALLPKPLAPAACLCVPHADRHKAAGGHAIMRIAAFITFLLARLALKGHYVVILRRKMTTWLSYVSGTIIGSPTGELLPVRTEGQR